jgi:hypothetical protein
MQGFTLTQKSILKIEFLQPVCVMSHEIYKNILEIFNFNVFSVLLSEAKHFILLCVCFITYRHLIVMKYTMPKKRILSLL